MSTTLNLTMYALQNLQKAPAEQMVTIDCDSLAVVVDDKKSDRF